MVYTEKLTKIQNTKSELKDNINDLGGNITTSTTFREYSDKLVKLLNTITDEYGVVTFSFKINFIEPLGKK